jgi:thiol-disulfide isomerase/thioredoxin
MRHRHFPIPWLTVGLAFVAIITSCFIISRDVPRNRIFASARTGGDERFIRLASFEQRGPVNLRGGVDWINSGPIAIQELRGKVVLLDFWTFCCINCHHILPELAKLEEKYKNELVVIGVHSPKFPAERDTENIRRKVREYRIKHPVINDANMTLWNRFRVLSWPTLVLIDALGREVDRSMGEGNFVAIDRTIGELVDLHKSRGELNLTPLHFTPEMDRPSNGPLLFPGKVLADGAGKRLFISDTGHNRIIQTNLDGTKPVVIGNGDEGFDDGDYQKATFNRPQGMCVAGDTLYVADTENHAIRRVDLKEATVTTIAGVGSQAQRIFPAGSSGPAKETPLCSPWDLIQLKDDKALYIAMAGPHQIWKLDVDAGVVGVFAGSGREFLLDGTVASACFAQPSGLATDGEVLLVADSEVSGLRVITAIHEGTPPRPVVRTIVGQGLFDFGDHDGRAAEVRLQHCLGLAYADGHLYVADTYNNKIKICEPKARRVKTFVGSVKAGDTDEPPHFWEPGGLSAADGQLYVADTNNHKIKVVDLKTHTVKTLALKGLSAPKTTRHTPVFPNAKTIDNSPVELAAAKAFAITVKVALPKGYKFNEETPMTWLVEAPDKPTILGPELRPEGQNVKPQTSEFKINVPLASPSDVGDKLDLKLFLKTFVCSERSSLCMIQSYIWNVPITFTAKGSDEIILRTGATP